MSDLSAILGLPYLLPSQAQKHVTHNEALRLLDILVHLRVSGFDAISPPTVPAEGEVYALGASPAGAWAGQAHNLAAFTEGAWAFITPLPGWRAWDLSTNELRIWAGTGWVLPHAEPDMLDKLGIRTGADSVNRLAVAADASLFSHDGAGHQLKINKASATDTAALLFQSGFTGHAELGLAGTTGFAVKVSADGAAWSQALVADSASGTVTLPAGMTLGTGSDTLDHYETGSWTPEPADAKTGGTPGTTGTATGRYIRIGDQVFASFELAGVTTSGLSAGTALYIRGLPFPARAHGSSRFTGAVRVNNVNFAQSPYAYLTSGDSAFRLMQNLPGASAAPLPVSSYTSGTADIFGALTYRT